MKSPFLFSLVVFLFFFVQEGNCQFYMFGGYNYGAIKLENANKGIASFNTSENHQLSTFSNNFNGFRFGLGRYTKYNQVEFGIGNVSSRNKSFTPNQLRENAEVLANYLSVSARLGYKPLLRQFLTVGAAFHLGHYRLRYSFGGNYFTPISAYSIAPEIYCDFAFRFKFLLKRHKRNEEFYVFKIRPYYQYHLDFSSKNFSTSLNDTPAGSLASELDNFSHFGIQISIIVPFLSESDRKLLIRPKSERQKRRKNKKKALELQG